MNPEGLGCFVVGAIVAIALALAGYLFDFPGWGAVIALLLLLTMAPGTASKWRGYLFAIGWIIGLPTGSFLFGLSDDWLDWLAGAIIAILVALLTVGLVIEEIIDRRRR